MAYRCFRRPRTTQERRANGYRYDRDICGDSRVHLRFRRSASRLPSNRDGLHRSNMEDRSWKGFRKTQYKAVSMDLSNCDPDVARVIELPLPFGSIVYHKIAKEKKSGLVIGFVVVPGAIKPLVKWSESVQEEHHLIELTTEYNPDFTQQ